MGLMQYREAHGLPAAAPQQTADGPILGLLLRHGDRDPQLHGNRCVKIDLLRVGLQ